MDPAKFVEFKADFQADATKISETLMAIVQKWKGREAEANSLTPDQNKEMEKIGDLIDRALDEMN